MPNWQSELDYRRREVHSRKEGVWDIQTTFMRQWKDNWFSSEFHDDASRKTSPLLHEGDNSIDLRGPSDQTIFSILSCLMFFGIRRWFRKIQQNATLHLNSLYVFVTKNILPLIKPTLTQPTPTQLMSSRFYWRLHHLLRHASLAIFRCFIF